MNAKPIRFWNVTVSWYLPHLYYVYSLDGSYFNAYSPIISIISRKLHGEEDHYNFLFQIGNGQNRILLTSHVVYMYLFHKVHQCKCKFATHDGESRSERSLELTQVSYSHDQMRLRRQVFMRTCMTLPLSLLFFFF